MLEAEKSHLAPEIGAPGRRTASRTRWAGPWGAALYNICDLKKQSEIVKEVQSERGHVGISQFSLLSFPLTTLLGILLGDIYPLL